MLAYQHFWQNQILSELRNEQARDDVSAFCFRILYRSHFVPARNSDLVARLIVKTITEDVITIGFTSGSLSISCEHVTYTLFVPRFEDPNFDPEDIKNCVLVFLEKGQRWFAQRMYDAGIAKEERIMDSDRTILYVTLYNFIRAVNEVRRKIRIH